MTVAYLTPKVNWPFKFEVGGNVPLIVGISTDFKVVDPGVIARKKLAHRMFIRHYLDLLAQRYVKCETDRVIPAECQPKKY